MRLPKVGPPLLKTLSELSSDNPQFLLKGATAQAREVIERANNEAWNWEDCIYHSHLAGLNAKELWVLVKLSRYTDRKFIPLRDTDGKPFSYHLPSSAYRTLHLIDTQLGGTIGSTYPELGSEEDRRRYLLRSLREEALASSQIEGAVVTREEAKEMLRKNRKPRTPGEQMVLNNYLTIQMLNQQRNRNLTIEMLLEVQRRITEHTLSKADAGGRFRLADENVVVWDEEDQKALHLPPPAVELPERMARFCDFANADVASTKNTEFIHPAVHAILLHFWLGYEHPFWDGNGRTARAIFYWAMLRHGYWLTEYLTISSIINGHPKQYARAYLDTEHDENDLSYFIVYHLGVIERSILAFRDYLEQKAREQTQAVSLLAGPFNTRERAALLRALHDPTVRMTYLSHARSHGVTIPTARTDLLHLEQLGLLKGNRVGRAFEFVPQADIREKLARLASS